MTIFWHYCRIETPFFTILSGVAMWSLWRVSSLDERKFMVCFIFSWQWDFAFLRDVIWEYVRWLWWNLLCSSMHSGPFFILINMKLFFKFYFLINAIYIMFEGMSYSCKSLLISPGDGFHKLIILTPYYSMMIV